MAPFPLHQPKTLSLGPLEAEIVGILWQLGPTSVTAVHQHILSDMDRELTYASVSTVLKRLVKKGWVECDRGTPKKNAPSALTMPLDSRRKIHVWRALVSKEQADVLKAHEQLHRFLAVGSPEIVAAFADTLDDESLAQIDAIAQKIKAARTARETTAREIQEPRS